jgi:hypothetical protein
MTHSDIREPGSGKNRLAICVSVLLLAFAVFGWGLRSKLSLYHIARASEATPIAKLLSERERPADATQHCSQDRDALDIAVAPLAITFVPLPAAALRARKRREEAPPLPSRTVTFNGPSLRRPPPSLVA